MKSIFIAFNISSGNIVINKIPIIYYWNSEDSLDDILADDKFKNYLAELCASEKLSYETGKIHYIFINDKNKYSEGNADIKEKYNIKEINGWWNILGKCAVEMENIYLNSFNKHFNDKGLSSVEIIKSIFAYIKDKYKEKISSGIIIRYLLKKIIKDNYSKENIKLIEEKLDSILKI